MSSITIHRWRGVHPVSNTAIMGAIVLLTEKNSVNFNTNNYNKQENLKGKSKKKIKQQNLRFINLMKMMGLTFNFRIYTLNHFEYHILI